MGTYIALLRGINVGGKNKVSMPLLKVSFGQAGFTQIRTYINSGNVIFNSESLDIESIRQHCEALIKEHFNLDITVSLISLETLSKALGNAPDWWDHDLDSKHNAIFVIPRYRAEDVVTQMGEIKPEYEKIAYQHPIIFWSAPIATFSRTRWSNVSKHAVYKYMTIRNANTTKKLLALAEKNPFDSL